MPKNPNHPSSLFVAENDVERALLDARKNQTSSEMFFKMLLNSEIFIPLMGTDLARLPRDKQEFKTEAEMKLNYSTINFNNQIWFPFFTHPSRIWQMTKDRHVSVPEKCHDLFTRNPGQQFILNPGSDFGRTFPANEVSLLLEKKWGEVGSEKTIPAGTKMLIGLPSAYPIGLLETLSADFRKIPQIETAFAPQVAIGTDAPRIIIEIVAPSSNEHLSELVKNCIQSAISKMGNGKFLDFSIRKNRAELLSPAPIEPFYTKPQKLPFWKKLFN